MAAFSTVPAGGRWVLTAEAAIKNNVTITFPTATTMTVSDSAGRDHDRQQRRLRPGHPRLWLHRQQHPDGHLSTARSPSSQASATTR